MTIKINTRRAAVAAAASLLLLTGCKSAEATWAEGAGTSSAAPAGGTTSLAADCTAAVAASGAVALEITPLSRSRIEATAVRKALTDYATAARSAASEILAACPRAAVEKQATAAETVSKAADPTDLESPEFESAAGEIEKICADALTPSAPPGAKAVRLGAAGSPCPLPVSFDLVALWKAKAVDVDKLGELASLARNGPFETVCEVDAKPAGEIGFLRVYLAPGRTGTPRSHLQTFVVAENPEARKAGNFEVRNIKFTDVTIGGQPAAEVSYEPYNKSLDTLSKYSAFAVNTPKGAVVVKLSPFGADEHANLLPAFELAKETLTINR